MHRNIINGTYLLLFDCEVFCLFLLGVNDTILPLGLVGTFVCFSRLNLRDTSDRSILLLLEVLFVCEAVVFLLSWSGRSCGFSGLVVTVGFGCWLGFITSLDFGSGVCGTFDFSF